MLRRLALTASVLSIGLNSAVAAAAVFDVDDRVVAPRTADSAYAPIGVVRPLTGVGAWLLPRYTTGFLIGECHVMTVQHLLGGSESPIGKRVSFTGGLTTKRSQTSSGTVVAAGGLEDYSGYDAKSGSKRYEAARSHDWMVLKLDTCIGSTLGYAELVAAIPAQPVKIAGFPNSLLREPLKVDPSCKIRMRTKRLFLHDCAARPGNSGSPIFVEKRLPNKTVLEVYAMQSAGWDGAIRPFSWAQANIATPVAQFLPSIAGIVQPRPKFAQRPSAGISARESVF